MKIPISEIKTLKAYEPGNNSASPFLKGKYGQKWLVTPYFGPPVAPVKIYAGHPKSKWKNS